MSEVGQPDSSYLIKLSNSIDAPKTQDTNKSLIVICCIATSRPFGKIDVFTNLMKPGPILASRETYFIFCHIRGHRVDRCKRGK